MKKELDAFSLDFAVELPDYPKMNTFPSRKGKPEMFRFNGGYYSFDEEGKMDVCHLYVQDYQGNNRMVVNAYADTVEQVNHYYSYGALMGDICTQPDKQKYKFGGKELDRKFGLDLHDFEARQQDPLIGRFTAIDPSAEKTPQISPYAYCGGDPVNCVDPDGKETHVIRLSNGMYMVTGGISNNDRNIYLDKNYLNDNGTVARSIGKSLFNTSFYNSDIEKFQVGAIIDPSNELGVKFIAKMHSPEVTLFNYMDKARTNAKNTGEVHPWDFKTTDGGPIILYKETEDHYRGMPFVTSMDGTTIYMSARDVGNIGAGIVAAKNGIGYLPARVAFDFYQGGIEGESTRNAEFYGWWTTYLYYGLFNGPGVIINNYNAVMHNEIIDNIRNKINQWITK